MNSLRTVALISISVEHLTKAPHRLEEFAVNSHLSSILCELVAPGLASIVSVLRRKGMHRPSRIALPYMIEDQGVKSNQSKIGNIVWCLLCMCVYH